jgi:hypothetical protein
LGDVVRAPRVPDRRMVRRSSGEVKGRAAAGVSFDGAAASWKCFQNDTQSLC